MTTAGSGNVARSLELMWQGDAQARPGPRPGLTLGQIVVAAVALADREGLSALSMRRVASELGVGTMSLYRYVPGKGELLDLMLDHVNGVPDGAPDPRSLSWRRTLEEMAWGIWDLYQAHPWLLHVNQSRPVLGPNSLAGFNHVLAGLADLDLGGRDGLRSSWLSRTTSSAPPARSCCASRPPRNRASPTRSSGPPRNRC